MNRLSKYHYIPRPSSSPTNEIISSLASSKTILVERERKELGGVLATYLDVSPPIGPNRSCALRLPDFCGGVGGGEVGHIGICAFITMETDAVKA